MLTNLRHIGLAVLCALALISCNGGNPASATKGETAFNDSLAYCMGQSQAYKYWQQASADSTLRGQQARKDYMDGYKAALSIMKSDNKAYNEGVLAGIQSAYSAIRFGESFDLTLNTKKLEEGMEAGMKSDKAVNQVMLHGMMDALKFELESRQTIKNRKAADAGLSALTSKEFKKAETGFYYREIKPGEGEKLHDKQIVRGCINLRTLDGREILKRTREGDVSVGSLSYPEALNNALLMMRPGAEYEFASPASDFFGIGTPLPDSSLKPSTPVIWTVTLGQLSK